MPSSKNILLPSLVITGLLSSPLVSANEIFPTPFTAAYELNRGVVHFGNTTRLLKQNSHGMYVFETKTKAASLFALVVSDTVFEQSIWSLEKDVVKPHSYTYQHSGGKKERDVKMEFDWQKGAVTNTINDDPWTMKIPAKTQDKHSLQFAIMRDLQLGKKELIYQVADGGNLKSYVIEQLKNEQIKTPMGTFDTLKIRYTKGKRETFMWCAKQLEYFPVQIEYIEKDGSRYQAKLVEFNSNILKGSD